MQETLEPVELTAIRVTVVREYTDPRIWNKLKKSGQTILELATSINGQDVRTHGWQHTDLGKEEFLTGYIKGLKGQEEALLGPAAWPESLFVVAERLKKDPETENKKSCGWKEKPQKLPWTTSPGQPRKKVLGKRGSSGGEEETMRWEWKERPTHLLDGPEFASRAACSGGDPTPPNSILNAVGLK